MNLRSACLKSSVGVLVAVLWLLPASLCAGPAGGAAGGPLAEEKEKAKDKDKKGGTEAEGKKDKKDGAQGEKKKKVPAKKTDSTAKGPTRFDLVAWGPIKEVKGTGFWTLTYVKMEPRKAAKRETVFVKVAEDAKYYLDKMMDIRELKEGDKVWLFGKDVEREAMSPTGYQDVDRQIQNVGAIVMGEYIQVNTTYKDPQDAKMKWLEAEVTKPGASITVSYDGNNYRVTQGKICPVLRREKGGEAKLLKNNTNVQVYADKQEERPETKSTSDAKKSSFLAKTVVILDPRLVRTPVYLMLVE